MTKKQAIEIIENEIRCVQRANYCDRDCANCPLVRKDEDILSAYAMAIKALEKPKVGKWIPESGVRIKGARVSERPDCCYCSVCKDFFTQDYMYMKYCPNCGSRLKVKKEWVTWKDKFYKRRSAE